ncbi:inositol-1-monophosphatase [Aeropyrum pernix]|uniref:Inositol-1-monophosphatase n=2 Tax=Aeropyrum pernix TaxID=56636 RepID=A0A401H849_AERPX|nr:inositol-1-monophosphatase [Aeropyrum pernix]
MMIDAEQLRRISVKVSSETAGLLRDLACSEDLGRVVSGETTVADKRAEDYILDLLRRELGQVQVISEEAGGAASKTSDAPIALVDPLDGSTNYLSCITWCSVSVAFADPRSGEILAGSVAPVYAGMPVSFARGKGCYHGGLKVEDPRIRGSIISVYVDEPGAIESVAGAIGRLKGVRRDFKVRSLGSAALELAYTAIGYIAVFADLRARLRNIDVAAAVGAVRECGGVVTDADGKPLRIGVWRVERVGSVVASLDEALARIAVGGGSG